MTENEKQAIEEYYSKEAESYKEKFSGGVLGWHRQLLREKTLGFLDAKEGEKILDAGCGVGFEAALLKKKGCDVLGVDLSRSMLERAAAQGIRTKVADFETMQLGEKFDKILCLGVLEFCKDPGKALLNFRRHIRDDGMLVLHIPRKNFLGTLYKFYHKKNKINITLFSRREAEGLLEEAGFSVQKIEKVGYFIFAVLAKAV